MNNVKYELRYLPLFYEELEEKAVYIAEKLMIYYVVIGDDSNKIMEVRRFLYNRQNRDAII